MATPDFTFGLEVNPADRPAAPHAEREGPQGWRAVITGVRNGEHFADWKSQHLFTTCANAKAVAEREFAKRVSL